MEQSCCTATALHLINFDKKNNFFCGRYSDVMPQFTSTHFNVREVLETISKLFSDTKGQVVNVAATSCVEGCADGQRFNVVNDEGKAFFFIIIVIDALIVL